MSADRDGKVKKEQEGHFIIHVLHPAASVLLSPADKEETDGRANILHPFSDLTAVRHQVAFSTEQCPEEKLRWLNYALSPNKERSTYLGLPLFAKSKVNFKWKRIPFGGRGGGGKGKRLLSSKHLKDIAELRFSTTGESQTNSHFCRKLTHIRITIGSSALLPLLSNS